MDKKRDTKNTRMLRNVTECYVYVLYAMGFLFTIYHTAFTKLFFREHFCRSPSAESVHCIMCCAFDLIMMRENVDRTWCVQLTANSQVLI